jgi:hypothetical protein
VNRNFGGNLDHLVQHAADDNGSARPDAMTTGDWCHIRQNCKLREGASESKRDGARPVRIVVTAKLSLTLVNGALHRGGGHLLVKVCCGCVYLALAGKLQRND